MKKMFKDKIDMIQRELDNTYGSQEGGGVRTIVAAIMFAIIAGFLFVIASFAKEKGVILYYYFSAEFILGSLMFISGYFLQRKKTAAKCKRIKYISMWVTLVLFFLLISPGMLVKMLLSWLGFYYRVESVSKNYIVVITDVAFYMVGLLICIVNPAIMTFKFPSYLLFIIIVYGILKKLTKLNEKYLILSSNQERYAFYTESRDINIYWINILTILSGIAGLFISKNADEVEQLIYVVMPVIMFAGLEQITLIPSKRVREKTLFLSKLYDELVILKTVALPQITEYSNLIIKIRLSVEPYMIGVQKNYLLSIPELAQKVHFRKKGNKKTTRELVESTLSDCEHLLNCRYAVYEEEECYRFLKEIDDVLEELSECLLRLRYS